MKSYDDVKIPYYIYNNIIFSKKISCSLKMHSKTITYVYDIYDKDGKSGEEIVHRTDGPAVILYRNNMISELQYYIHGKKHREFGPAIIRLNKKHEVVNEEWFKNGKKISDKEIEEIKILIDRKKKMLKLLSKIKTKSISNI